MCSSPCEIPAGCSVSEYNARGEHSCGQHEEVIEKLPQNPTSWRKGNDLQDFSTEYVCAGTRHHLSLAWKAPNSQLLYTSCTLHYLTLHYITLHYITLHYITLHYITLHYITLHVTLHVSLMHPVLKCRKRELTVGA
jgi:hypothetical protein